MSRVDHGEYAWLSPITASEFNIPIGCRIVRTEKNKTLICDDEGLETWVPSTQILKGMHLTSQRGVDDMITLGDLQEYAILRNLHIRYLKKQIYTYTGSMLVAINPYEILPIYKNSEIELYRNKIIGDAPPHIFAIGDSAYQAMKKDSADQCIVISGESGAGKTESTKLILQYLATTSGKHSWIEQQIVDANPILEAFGNAKTVRNDNSSRFGKYIDIHFNTSGSIEGAKIDQYLLEKSRIVSLNKGERNYHIFYSLLAGLTKDERKRLDLEDVSKYEYLTGGDTISCENRDEAQEFDNMRAAMKVLTFEDSDVNEIFKLLAAILHLGNLKYKGIVVQNIDATEVNDNVNAAKVATLLGVAKSLLTDSLTRRTIFAHGERVVSSISKEAALEARDAFVKAIYGKVFVKIVDQINDTIYKTKSKTKISIGVLDIFGFENFTVNSFEQLCINYANENLQQFFVRHIFKMEQENYTKEGINWQHIEFIDNQDILDMIGMKPMNVMSLIDEESRFPKGTDLTMLVKLNNSHGTKKIYIKPKSDHIPSFGIQHFAGTVDYHVPGFLEKNRDSFSTDMKELVSQSSNRFLLELFSDDSLDTTKKSVTLSSQFRNSLELLMKTLSACHPFFVRCIKPNELKKPNIFDKALCVRQLRYSGMMETAKIRRAGYPIRHTYKEFVERYRHLAHGIGPAHKVDCREAARKICDKVLASSEHQFGHTKIFLKDAHDTLLEKERERIYLKYILILQRGFRRVIFRKWIRKIRNAAITLQKHYRARGYRENYLIMRNGFRRMQTVIKSRQLVHEFTTKRKSMVLLQAQCRGYLVRKRLRGKTSEKAKRMQELMVLRRREEQELKKSGESQWREIAENRYYDRVAKLSRELEIEKEEVQPNNFQNGHEIYRDEDQKVVDDVFGFLPDGPLSPEPELKHRSSNGEMESVITIPNASKKRRENLSEFNFNKFAATYFTNNNSAQFSKRILKGSLLDLPLPADELASQAIWVTILRFMGDMAEAKYEEETLSKKPIMQKLNQTLGRSFAKSKMYNDALNDMSDSDRQKLIHRTLKGKSKLPQEMKKIMESSQEISDYQEWLSSRSSSLEKLHFIIGHGILRPILRDEIFCQIAKQLTYNPTMVSHSKGWILLSLCIGCFPPSENLKKYLIEFIRNGPELYAPYCEDRLMRTIQNGARRQPPSWKELQATKTKMPIPLQITLTDGTNRTVEVDSASTSEEICEQLAANMKMTDSFGFSIYITISGKVMSLGSCGEHIMDAISHCEQYTKEQGGNERNAPYHLLYRKEMFTPWYSPVDDPIATDLIYRQIVRGVNFGEYRCKTERDIAVLAALQYYAENGRNLDPALLRQLISDYVPKDLLTGGSQSIPKWEKLIQEQFARNRTITDNSPRQMAKEDIAIFGQLTWQMMFSRFYEVVQIDGPKLPIPNMIIAINSTGVYFLNEKEQTILKFTFVEIESVASEVDEETNIGMLTINTVNKDEYVFKSFDVITIRNLIDFILRGLKSNSVYAVAIQDYTNASDPTQYLQLRKGDLIILSDGYNGEKLMTSDSTWGNGRANGREGDFPTEVVYILPTMQPPTEEMLKMFTKESSVKPKKHIAPQYNTVQRQRMHTLRRYATEHFRKSMSPTTSTTISAIRRTATEDLCSHTRDQMRAPLLLKLQKDPKLFDSAVTIFVQILKYMGDLPRGRVAVNTDSIFKPAMNNELLKDEVYCQIMRQLTENPINASEERGWDLMWLATGVMYPSPTLLKELTEFLKTRTHPLAVGSLSRLQKLLKTGERKHPPYIVEIDAIRKRVLQIYHRVYFPNDTDEAFEIDSLTKASDVKQMITKRLNLKSGEGFSLFVKISDKAFSVPDEFFLFDFIYELVEWVRETLPSRTADIQVQAEYQIFFMKKLWINMTPGKDQNADQIFYYYQEVPKLMNSYYKLGKNEAVKLGALIYRVQFGNDAQSIQQIGENLMYLVPNDTMALMKPEEWRKAILSMYNSNRGMSVDDAKTEFLKIISQLPLFGSTFFVVKQTTDRNYPVTLLIAINKNGFHIIDSTSKDVLMSYQLSDLNGWNSGNTYFNIRFGNMMGSSKLFCETTQGYKMDDLLGSYNRFWKESLQKLK